MTRISQREQKAGNVLSRKKLYISTPIVVTKTDQGLLSKYFPSGPISARKGTRPSVFRRRLF